MPQVELSEKIGKLTGVIEGMQDTLDRIEGLQEGMTNIMREHIRDDYVMRRDVDDLQQWRDGDGDNKGAEAQLNDMHIKGYWIMGFGACISFFGGIVAAVGGGKIGAWFTKVFG